MSGAFRRPMKRKLIKQGHNTLTVTIPSKWARQLGLQAGDEIELTEKENGLFLSGSKQDDDRQAYLDITNMSVPSIWKYLMGIYREGYQEAKISFEPGTLLENPYKFLTKQRTNVVVQPATTETVDILHHFIDRFIGFEIVESSRNFIRVKQLGEPSPKEFSNAFRRIFLLLNQMGSEIIEAMENGKPKTLAHIHSADINVDKFHDYCVRLLNQTNIYAPQKTHLVITTLYLLELVGDEFKNIAVHLQDSNGPEAFSIILNFSKKVYQQWLLFHDLSFSFKQEKVKKLTIGDAELYLEVPTIHRKASEREKEIFHHFRIISRYLNALLELRIQQEYSC